MSPSFRTGLFVAAAMLTAHAGYAAAEDGHRVAIEYQELSGTQDMSSAPWVAHAKGVHLWEMDKPANTAIQVLAEDGNPEFILGAALNDDGRTFGDFTVGLPNRPGTRRRVELTVDARHPLVSGGWMLGHTNDGFAGLDAVDAYGLTGPVTVEVYALDAGTEVDTESKADAVGGLGHVAEKGVVHRHTGIRGDADIPASFKFDPSKPIGRITISPIASGSTTGLAQ